jgi:squalene-hopene/tetraprenyl-beta-curcumene cyclase
LNDLYVIRGLEYLLKTQRPWGSWYGRWGVNHVYGTWCVISALAALGTGQDMVDRAAAWLLSVQNPDGGWGESCHSYVDESFAGIGRSTPSQTAWAVLALQLAGRAPFDEACPERSRRAPDRLHAAAGRGLAYLCDRQRRDGTWEEPECTGTGFPGDFYINYHLYRHLFPTMALAQAAKDPQEIITLSEASESERSRRAKGEGGQSHLALKEAIQ